MLLWVQVLWELTTENEWLLSETSMAINCEHPSLCGQEAYPDVVHKAWISCH
jgi:hypothetical protein